MSTALLGILTFLAVLGPLVILHELGHFFAARLSGVKIVEFGFGFPPRIWGLWTGRTSVLVTSETQVDPGLGGDLRAQDASGMTDPRRIGALVQPGDMVAMATRHTEDGRCVARAIFSYRDRSKAADWGDVVAGKLRAVDGDTLFVSEMVWSFNLLPIGGFVKMVGEEDPSAVGSLASKGKAARAFVMASGSAVNAVLPLFIFALVAMVPQSQVVGQVVISGVMPGSPAEGAGLRQGDIISHVDGKDIENIADLQRAVTLRLGAESEWGIRRGIPDPHPAPGEPRYQYPSDGTETVHLTPRWRPPTRRIVREVSDPSTEIPLWRARQADPLTGVSRVLRVVRSADDTTREISLEEARDLDPRISLGDRLRVVPVVEDPTREISLEEARRHDAALGVRTRLQEGAVGITIRQGPSTTETRWVPPWTALGEGYEQLRSLLILTKNGIVGIAIGSENPQFEGPATVGPIGIGQLTGEIASSGAGLVATVSTLANLAATLSLSLAVINILPVPALDGGRLLFVVIEFLRGGKRISPEREGLVHIAGMVVLLTLIALISVQDILRIIRGESFF